MDFNVPFLEYKYLKQNLMVLLVGNTVDMVTYCVAKMLNTVLASDWGVF